MAGFFAIRRGTFAQGDEISPIGYKIGLELMVKCGCRNIREIPIHFRDRTLGQSKLSLREQLHYLLHVVRLLEYRFEPLACPAKFCLVGATGMAVDLAALALLLDFLPLPVSRGLAIWGAMTWNFTLNRHFTFRGERQRDVVKQYGLFCASCLAGALVNWGVSVGLGRGVPFCGRHLLFAAGLGVIAGTGLNYLFSRYVTFRRRTGLGNDAPA
jgi:dolichol-phosphate mannosyltransferase